MTTGAPSGGASAPAAAAAAPASAGAAAGAPSPQTAAPATPSTEQAAAPPVNAKGQNPPDPNRAAPTRPEWLEEKHWDAEKGAPKVEDLAKGYKEATSKLSTRKDDLAKEVRADLYKARPAAPTDYKFELPGDWKAPDGVTFTFGDATKNPVMQALAKTAHDAGLDQGQFSAMLKGVADEMVKSVPKPADELAKLGEKAQDRVNAVKMWGERVLGRDGLTLLLGQHPTAKHVETIEKLMQASGVRVAPGSTQAPPAAKKTLAELRHMQADPRYSDPMKRDPAFVAQVDAGYAALYPSQGAKPIGPAFNR
jgi:hypothetical protein